MNTAIRLRLLLADQRFPAERWELITAAEAWGADSQTRRDLRALPPMRFGCLRDVVVAVERAAAHTI